MYKRIRMMRPLYIGGNDRLFRQTKFSVQQSVHCIGRVHADFGRGRYPETIRTFAMLTKTKIALSAALVLGTASAALAATKHPVRHDEKAVQARTTAQGANAYGYAPSAPHGEETYIWIQDQGYRDSN
jgi:hypothetical protein